MDSTITTLPQQWAAGYKPLPAGWLQTHAPNLLRRLPEFPRLVSEAAQAVGVAEHLLVTRCELEQSALSYAWDCSTTDYGGGWDGEAMKLKYLCGADRTDSGDRPGGWFDPRLQLLACALRFRYWYRGEDGPRPEWRNWLGLEEDPAYRPGVKVTRPQGEGMVWLTPTNQISADCLRYTSGMDAQETLREIAMSWFPEEFTDTSGGIAAMSTLSQVSPDMEGAGAWLKAQTPGHGSVQAIVFHHTEDPAAADFQGLSTIEGIKAYHMSKGWSDIGAQFYTCPDGSVYTGRPISDLNWCHAGAPWRSDVEEEAAAISGMDDTWFNSYAIGIETVANFDNEDPFGTGPASHSYECTMKLMVTICQLYGLDSSKVFFHRNVSDKTCPGMKLSRADVREDLHNRLLAAAGTPAAPAAPPVATGPLGLNLRYNGNLVPCNIEEIQRDGMYVARGDVRAIVEGIGLGLKYTAEGNDGAGYLDVVPA